MNEVTEMLLNLNRFPKKENDCVAMPICAALGNLNEDCMKGANMNRPSYQNCMASMILLVARGTRQISEKQKEQIVEAKRKIGFSSFQEEPGR